MSPTPSNMVPLGTKAPEFSLPDPQGKRHSLDEFKNAPALLIAFICNHCPFVKHIQPQLVSIARDYRSKGLAVVAISSNDVAAYPDDGPEFMAKESEKAGYTFPYLYDETQKVAKAYNAACTPDLFVYDRDRKLAYRGQLDDSRPKNGLPLTGKDLRAAIDAVLQGRAAPAEQKPSVGCNIKWKSGNEPAAAAH